MYSRSTCPHLDAELAKGKRPNLHCWYDSVCARLTFPTTRDSPVTMVTAADFWVSLEPLLWIILNEHQKEWLSRRNTSNAVCVLDRRDFVRFLFSPAVLPVALSSAWNICPLILGIESIRWVSSLTIFFIISAKN